MSPALTIQRPRGATAVAALAFAALLAILVGGASIAGGASAKPVGKTKRTPNPSCPSTQRQDCQAVGSVTAFQVAADGKQPLMRFKSDGRLLAWAIDLAKPTKQERASLGALFENNRFGTKPTARIAVLKGLGNSRYRLKKQGPVVVLGSSLGQKQYITLNDPLRVRKGDILALTVPTWSPNFAYGLRSAKNTWKASRAPGKCNNRNDILNGKPQQKVRSERKYGCTYRGARVLYWGYYAPDRD